MTMTTRKRARQEARCAICGRATRISFDLLRCCETCQDAVVAAEDAGGHWRAAYLTNGRLVECEGAAMRRLCGHLLPRPPALPSGAGTPENVLAKLRTVPRVLVLLGSGASANYGIPINLASSDEADPLTRYAPVRQAVLELGDGEIGGLYRDLRALLDALAAEAGVVSTNIDDLATRAGLDELQLHGSTGSLQCDACGVTWAADADWPPADCATCGKRPRFNLPTNTLCEEEVVWTEINKAHRASREFLAAAAGAPLAVLAVGVATHVHSLTPELQLVLEARAGSGDRTDVAWINLRSHDGAVPGALELLGDAGATVAELRRLAERPCSEAPGASKHT